MNLRNHYQIAQKMQFADMQLDQKFEEFMLGDEERRELRRKQGKHYDSFHNKVKIEESSVLTESQIKRDRLEKNIKYA